MAKRMLIDATHPEETRVVVVDGTKLDEFDFEVASRKPLKGNVYLAKVVRIEPSLQAAFVEYGGNRHGFLAFNEIHPDYYQIPVADRERLIAEQAQRHQPHDDGDEPATRPRRSDRIDRSDIEDADEQRALLHGEAPVAADEPAVADGHVAGGSGADSMAEVPAVGDTAEIVAPSDPVAPASASVDDTSSRALAASIATDVVRGPAQEETVANVAATETIAAPAAVPSDAVSNADASPTDDQPDFAVDPGDAPQPEIPVETLGGDEIEIERPQRRSHPSRQYKIQEVIKRRQILLVQVVKEERGNKGAALTTYLSLAGRYAVLMPNAGRGGGISRKITNAGDRKRMKEMLSELEVPQGMGVILRTAGLERSKQEIRRDYDYLMRLWDSIRALTLQSTAPALIYEEGDIVKRSLRDLYNGDIDEILVEGEEGFGLAQDFMRQLIPSQVGRVKSYDDPVPLFHRYQIEAQLDAMHSPVVQLRSGAYIVINPTEALVAIDVNSGRSTKERNIEETALKTNLDAADEIARQVRLRDLAGLVVVDFIDMEESRHQAQVERRVKEAMRLDRARIQIGRISPFGLLEMSRQRLRPSLLENSTEICPHCEGTGRIRSVESTALHVLRGIEDEAARRRASEIVVRVPTPVALYILNHKRAALGEMEERYGLKILLTGDDRLIPPNFEIERTRARIAVETVAPARITASAAYDEFDDDDDAGSDETAEPAASGGEAGDDAEGQRRRRRRRRRRRDDEPGAEGQEERQRTSADGAANDEPPRRERSAREDTPAADEPAATGDEATVAADAARDEDDANRRRRRGRRGGRGRRREDGTFEGPDHGASEHSAPEANEGAALEDSSATPTDTVAHVDDSRPEVAPIAPVPAATDAAMAPPAIAEPAVPVHAEPVHVATPAAPSPAEPAPTAPVQEIPVVPEPAPAPAAVVEPTPAPAIPSIAVEAPAEKPKRGWWSRLTNGT